MYTKCIPCPPYGVCSASAFTKCLNGYKINANGDGCEQCPIGQDSVDGLNCVGCTAGAFKPLQSYPTCVACPLGASSCGGSLVACQSGYYFDLSAQCKRNETYFSLQQTGTATGTTYTDYVTFTQTSTSTTTTTSTSTSSVYITATATQVQPLTVSHNAVTFTQPPLTVAGQFVYVTVTNTVSTIPPVVVATQTLFSTVTASVEISSAGGNAVGAVQVNAQSVNIDGVGTLPISPLVFGIVAFAIGVMLALIAAIICCHRRSSNKINVDFEDVGLTTALNNTTSQRTFTTRSSVR